MQKTMAHPLLGEITYIKRLRSKTIRVSINLRRGIQVSLPFWITYRKAEEFVEQNITKISGILKRLQTKSTPHNLVPYSTKELTQIRKRAKETLPARLQYYSAKLNLKYNKLFIKNNRSNWGSCSAKGNINLNMHLVNLPQELCDYVIIHELCHLVHKNHGPEFHQMVNSFCGGKERELSAQLHKWSHLLQRIP